MLPQIYFVTGNAEKFSEAQAVIPSIQRLTVDLPEIQHIDPRKILEAKLEAASEIDVEHLIVDDTSLYFNTLNGLPGPLIKWFLKCLNTEGLYKLALDAGDFRGEAVAMIAYKRRGHEAIFVEGRVSGTIVFPRGEGFGWDPIFKPDGESLTFAEMSDERKSKISHRALALQNLVAILQTES